MEEWRINMFALLPLTIYFIAVNGRKGKHYFSSLGKCLAEACWLAAGKQPKLKVICPKTIKYGHLPKTINLLIQSSFPFLANVQSSVMDAFIMGNISIRNLKCPKDESESNSSPIHANLADIETFDFFPKINGLLANVLIAALPLIAPYNVKLLVREQVQNLGTNERTAHFSHLCTNPLSQILIRSINVFNCV